MKKKRTKIYKLLSDRYVSTEQMRIASRNLQHSIDFRNKTIFLMITSANATKGKSIISVKLAASFAEQGKKVLVVDTNFKSPMINELFQISNELGFSNIINGQIDSRIPIKTSIPYLSILPAGLPMNNTFRMSLADRLSIIKKNWATLYDIVIFDSPSLLEVSDSQDFMNICDGVVLVVKENKTNKEEVSLISKSVTRAEKKVLGVIYQVS
ncbi:CpsD/CapB family tyrosine-protein kinase [Guptibacillus hwajinpoensis]|uniref:CpsD/CapB family tyrosine-protein kinase n=1 Tax=Guptibacillus hwajinpoensis TaxID=208199 RepID=UPI001CD74837|nr:CpsD/CapB family tyrosine-protein kinase [Pseudalkalibacillus hwajinpoensis]MCA0991436.1 CpsD/CapB family tyrosine-protein kinase [Pseudalkalibacillus hwajinpoensis]